MGALGLQNKAIANVCGLTAMSAILFGLTGCLSDEASKAGVVPSVMVTYGDFASYLEDGLSPEWLSLRPSPGTQLSPDETYLRQFAEDVAAPDDEKVHPWRLPFYMTRTGLKLGPPAAPEQTYYVAQSYKWFASEEARVNVLLADLYRANARMSDYHSVADRVLDQEDARMLAIHESDLISSDPRELEELVAHSIGNRHAISFALQSITLRVASYSYAAKRARIDWPGSADHFNIEAQIANLSHHYTELKARVDGLDQQIKDVVTQPAL